MPLTVGLGRGEEDEEGILGLWEGCAVEIFGCG